MWMTMSRREKLAFDLKCFALGTICMAVLLGMIILI